MSSRPLAARWWAATFPECEPPRTIFGAPIRMFIPCWRDACAAAIVVGNSAMTLPSWRDSSTCSQVASSWLASAIFRSRQMAAMRCRLG
ncbi:Uncharacterised protein [Klebsiella michiganensis]|uniref:Uncharacterized protein n=1 Tax=Klebsiella michiganensis TaxID=1134687 RepID=A0A7H4PDA4_9ENTR|nr:Uncharacterised protein [Klebsiella michiganensis]